MGVIWEGMINSRVRVFSHSLLNMGDGLIDENGVQ